MKKGVQLYGFRNELKADFAGTLHKLAELGFDGVEFYSFHGDLNAIELKKLLDETGLECAGLMYPADLIRDVQSVVYQETKVIDTPAVTHSLMTDFTTGFDAILRDLQTSSEIAEACGVPFSYHNHWAECEKVDGIPALVRIMEATDPDKFFLEPDVCWLTAGGLDPVEIINTYKERILQIHLKDIANPADASTMTALGDGCVPIKEIISAGKKSRAKWFIYEQDYSSDPFADAEKSLKFMQQFI